MFDYHSHSHFSFDCEIELEEMVKAGIKAGLVHCALTDHFEPNYPNLKKRVLFDLQAYEGAVSTLKTRYRSQIQIRKGLELGLQPDVIPLMEQRLRGEHFDFLIASFHYVGKYELCDPAYFSSQTPEEAYRRFYGICLQTLREFQMYDVMGHVNIIDRYAPVAPPNSSYVNLIEEIFSILIRRGKGIEFNTSCFRYEMGGVLTPSVEMLRLYRAMGGKLITVGSDAHFPQHAGAGIQKAYHLLYDLGFSEITVYESRMPTQIALKPLISS